MACCSNVMLTVMEGGCPSNNSNPTPASLLVVSNVDFGTFTISIAAGQVNAPQVVLPTVTIGTYKADFISGFIPWQALDYSVSCVVPPALSACGDACGNDIVTQDIQTSLVFTSPLHGSPQTLVGQECRQCGLVDSCNTTTLQANTLAANPSLLTSIDSSTYGRNMPNVTVATLARIDAGTDGVSKGGSITWRLTQTQHIFPQPLCVGIRDYATVKAAIGICPSAFLAGPYCAFNPPCVPTTEWDGTFPYRVVLFPAADDARVTFYPGDDNSGLTPKPPNGPPHFDTCELTLNGMAMATTTAAVFETRVQFRNTGTGGYWELAIMGFNDPTGGVIPLWYGRKTTGDTPVGTYTTFAGGSPCVATPETICIEECVQSPLTQTNTINTPQVLYGSAAYAQTTDITVRPNLIFFTDLTGLRKIADVTIQGGSTSFGGDIGHHLDYAITTDRVFVSVIAATSYIAVVNPTTMGIDTTFNNALAYQFNYLKYSPQIDRLFATQSDGANLHGRVINPNTNSIVGNFTFSTNAANEFQGGIDYWPTGDAYYIARQGSTPTTQSIRIFNGTSLAFTGSIDLGTLTPNDMIYVDDWGRFVVVGVDFNTNAGLIAVINPAINNIEALVPTGSTFSPTSIIYDPQKSQVCVDCSTTFIYFSMRTETIVGSSPITSAGISMAFNPTNNKVYHPKSGTSSIDVFG